MKSYGDHQSHIYVEVTAIPLKVSLKTQMTTRYVPRLKTLSLVKPETVAD